MGERYSDGWHVDHLTYPQSVVPESVMPPYGFLLNHPLDGARIGDLMATHRLVGVPYSDDMVANAKADFAAQADPNLDTAGLEERYPGVHIRDFDGRPGTSEMEALVAYLQVLGTMVDFSTFTPDASR